MKQWLKGTALCLAIILLFSFVGGGSVPATQISTAPTEPLLSTVPSLPATEATAASTLPTEPATVPTETPTEPPVTAPPTRPTTPPTTPATKPTETKPTDPPVSQEITVGSYISGVSAKRAFVYDFSTRSYLYMKGEADAKLYPASISKLMNAYTALKILGKDTVLTVGRDVLDLVPSGSSIAYLRVGDRLSVETALKALLLPSGSDAAHLLAVAAGRKLANNEKLGAKAATSRFVEEMNRQAELMGLANTHFVTADGNHDYNHYSCMADITILAAACLDIPLIRDIVKMPEAPLKLLNRSGGTLKNTNYLLRASSSYYSSEACGMKTGYTKAAGKCLLSLFYANGRYLLIGAFQCTSEATRCQTTLKLFQTFRNAAGIPPVVDNTEITLPSEDTAESTTETVPSAEETVSPQASEPATETT